MIFKDHISNIAFWYHIFCMHIVFVIFIYAKIIYLQKQKEIYDNIQIRVGTDSMNMRLSKGGS